MKPLLQFNEVTANNQIRALSFIVRAGDLRVLKVASEEAKVAVIDLVLGELLPAKGEVLLHGQSLDAFKPGNIGLISAKGGLISNLKTWENITLPLWYHGKPQPQIAEETVSRWLLELAIDKQDWENFMARPAARLQPWERKMAGLLRGLLLAPQLLLIDAGLLEDVEAAHARSWISALEKYVRESEGRAALVVTSTSSMLPWETINIAT